MDTPIFILANKDRKNKASFDSAAKADIKATMQFLFKRGMWSKYHYTHWMRELESMECSEMLHLWWDAITGGAMFETESMISERLEALEEYEEDKVEKEKMGNRNCKKNMGKHMYPPKARV